MNKFIKCRLRVIYSNGEITKEEFVDIAEASLKKDRIKAINTIKDLKKLMYYWIEDLYTDKIGRFGQVKFNNKHQLIS